MSKRDVRLFVQEMIEAIQRTSGYLCGFEYADFEIQRLVQDAVLRNLEVIGEAARNIPDELRERFRGIPWKRIVGFRNVAIHAYFDVDLAEVWRIATEDMPELKGQLQNMLDELGGLPPLKDSR